jgi:hypothetical protein
VTASVSGENLEKYRCKMQLCKTQVAKFWRVRILIFNFLRAKHYIFAYFRTDYSFPAITMLNLEVMPDYYFIFLGTQFGSQKIENKYSDPSKFCNLRFPQQNQKIKST